MTREQILDAAERAGWTFVQGAMGAAPLTFVPDWAWLQQTGAVMLAAGLASVLSLAKSMVRARRRP